MFAATRKYVSLVPGATLHCTLRDSWHASPWCVQSTWFDINSEAFVHTDAGCSYARYISRSTFVSTTSRGLVQFPPALCDTWSSAGCLRCHIRRGIDLRVGKIPAVGRGVLQAVLTPSPKASSVTSTTAVTFAQGGRVLEMRQLRAEALLPAVLRFLQGATWSHASHG